MILRKNIRIKQISPNFRYEPRDKNTKEKQVIIDYPERYLQLDIYKKHLETPQLYKDIKNVLHVGLTAVCRSHCEAVVEGMGSVVTAEMKERGRLDLKTMEREALIRWQGPHPGFNSSTELIKIALNIHFKGRSNWHFCCKDHRSKYFNTSEVSNRVKNDSQINEKISFQHQNI